MQGAPPPYEPTKDGAPPPVNPMYPNPPAQGYAPPPQGYAQPQQGYAQPQQGYQQPQQGYPPQQGYQQGYPPPQQGYAPQYPQPQYTTPAPAQSQPVKVVTVVSSFGSVPQRINCVNCRTEQVTKTSKRIGAMNWIVCGITAVVILILTGIFLFPIVFLPFAFIALCIPGLMDTAHVCPNCNHLNGVSRVA